MNSKRERVKEKIIKLLNVTRDRGASENEAMMAAERAAELTTSTSRHPSSRYDPPVRQRKSPKSAGTAAGRSRPRAPIWSPSSATA